MKKSEARKSFTTKELRTLRNTKGTITLQPKKTVTLSGTAEHSEVRPSSKNKFKQTLMDVSKCGCFYPESLALQSNLHPEPETKKYDTDRVLGTRMRFETNPALVTRHSRATAGLLTQKVSEARSGSWQQAIDSRQCPTPMPNSTSDF